MNVWQRVVELGWEFPDLSEAAGAGRHARTSIGVNALPQGIAVEVDAVFAVR